MPADTDCAGTHYMSAWPLMLLEGLGLLGNNPEGFYNEWYGTSILVSLGVQIVVLYGVFYRCNSHNNHSQSDAAKDAAPLL